MAKCKNCGKSGLFQQLSSEGICLKCLEASITPEMKEANKLSMLVADKKAELESLEHSMEEKSKALDAEIKSKADELNRFSDKLKNLQQQILVAEDNVELESFSLYHPKFSFCNSDEYKERLKTIRDQEKVQLRNKTAVSYYDGWTVNGSKAEGRKMNNENIKLLLRAFNDECDIAISSAKFSNFDRCQQRIEKAYETVNKLGITSRIRIMPGYLSLKLDELHLAYEYECKKQEEKEAQRALREQQREEALLAKEIEAARKEAEKEKKHYIQALEKLDGQLADCTDSNKRKDLEARKDEVVGYLDGITAKLADMDYRQANQKAGYVYVISNIGSFGEGVYKIGMTRRLDPMERVYELGDASVPFFFDVHAMIFSDDAPKLEAALHRAFADRRVNKVNLRREYFRVTLDEIKAVVRANHDKTVDFIEAPEAQQYRETLLMER